MLYILFTSRRLLLLMYKANKRRTSSQTKPYKLKDVRGPGERTLSNQEIITLPQIVLEENIARLNVVGLVSRAGDTHLQDIEVFRNIMNFL